MKRCVESGVLLAVVGLVMGAGVAIAGKAGDQWPTKVTVSHDPRDDADYFEGTVSSENPTCVKSRKVVVKFLDGNEKIGSDKTNARGSYEVKVSGAAASGTYKAIAKRAERRGIVCKKGTDT